MIVVVLVGLMIILSWFRRFLPTWKSDFLALLLFGIGLVVLSWPAILSHYLSIGEYRLWIIQGPAPFDSMGGGPYMIAKYLIWIVIGFGMIIAALQTKRRSLNRQTNGESEHEESTNLF